MEDKPKPPRYHYPPVNCDNCGKEFAPTRRGGRFCCSECSRTYMRRHGIGFFRKETK